MLLLAIAACRRADGLPLGEVGRRLGSRLPRRRLGRRVRDRRRAPLPRPHELERGQGDRRVVGAVRRLEGRARRLGRDPASACSSAPGSCAARATACALFMDAVAPGLLLAQGIGRWGNWFNQELFGKPTDLPWGLKIDEAHRGGYIQYTTFHPTFLYEFIWDIVGVIVLLLVDSSFRIRRPALFALYVALVLLRALLRGAAAHRSGARVLRAAAERLRLDRAASSSRRRSSSGGSSCARRAARIGRARSGSSRRARPWPCRRAASAPAR